MEQQIIKCVFCKGKGENPHFRGTCPVCKGKGENQVTGKYMACGDCRGSGQKRGTTLTCYACAGLGVIPDTRETFRIAREEIGEAQKEMARERDTSRYPSGYRRAELTEKGVVNITPKSKKHKFLDMFSKRKGKEDEIPLHFCQCCGNEVNESITVKICSDCFSKVKELRG